MSPMKRLRRWVFNGLASLSLLLFVATGALWARSYAVEYEAFRLIGPRLYGSESLFGRLEFEVTSGWPPQPEPGSWGFSTSKIGGRVWLRPTMPNKWRFLGFGWDD